MTKEELITFLKGCQVESEEGDREKAHSNADRALLKYIDDAQITAAFNSIKKWYS